MSFKKGNETPSLSDNRSHAMSVDSVQTSSLGQLVNMIEGHLMIMNNKDKFVEQYINDLANIQSNSTIVTLLRQAKKKALNKEKELLQELLNSPANLTQFLQNIILIENKFNKLYQSYKSKQELSRNNYAKNIYKYELNNKPLNGKKISSFVELFVSAQSIYLDLFIEFMKKIQNECQKQNIIIYKNTGVSCKKIARAFYKSFYVYSQDSYGYRKLTDILRFSFVFSNFDDLYRTFSIIEVLSKEIGGILRAKDRFNPKNVMFGYRDLLINVYCPDCKIVCEIQLHHRLCLVKHVYIIVFM